MYFSKFKIKTLHDNISAPMLLWQKKSKSLLYTSKQNELIEKFEKKGLVESATGRCKDPKNSTKMDGPSVLEVLLVGISTFKMPVTSFFPTLLVFPSLRNF